MKEYIRSTHNFDNNTREWEYRGDKGQDKYGEIGWSFGGNGGNEYDERHRKLGSIWSFGVHALERDSWRYMRTIIDNTINMYKGHASDSTKEFEEFIKNNPNHRELIKKDILKELEILIELDMVRVRDNKMTFDTNYWDT